MELPLVYYPDPLLRLVCKPVTTLDETVKQMVTDLFDTHYAQENCAALAAPQLGLMARITVIDFSEAKNEPLCLINPEITCFSQETTLSEEGCMSIPGVYAKVPRAQSITVKALNEHGKPVVYENIDGFMAKVMQHEIDHLDGVLFTDRLSPLKRNMVLQKYAKLRKANGSRK